MAGVLTMLFVAAAWAQDSRKVEEQRATGKEIAYDRSRGNCLACHAFPTQPDAVQTGNSGAPIIAMRARFPDKALLRALVWDATAFNPDSMMPPFGRHRVLSEEEIDKVVDFIYGL
ncbi:MAG TPA: sulfur oxidation c-type cytochrome SoxX [Thiobacillaceae bacterium]|nr:sulfur oxidation c-type cytochrome SoxX [Thiobacillaceae bacterium]HNU64097.1 sulfur oxidation c-type cytochrome SoxX [Thiobacillaceae bacterium]